MAHEYAVYGAMAGIIGLTAFALYLGIGNGLVASAITALTTLSGVKIALGRREGEGGTA